MTPAPTFWHQRMVARLTAALAAVAPTGYEVLGGTNVSPNDGQDGLIPDVVVQRTLDGLFVHPRDVLLVVDVESPSTSRQDRLVKPSLYASWAIPRYWRVTDSGVVTQVLRGSTYVDAVPDGWLSAIDLSVPPPVSRSEHT